MVARSGVVFSASMADILANPVEICFGSFTATSTTLATVTSPTVSMKVPATPVASPSSNLKSKTHPPKPYDIVQGMERVIDMMEETFQICERAQRSTQDASRRKTFPLVCCHLATPTPVKRPSPSRSNLGGRSRLATSRSSLAPVAIHSTYRAPTKKAHDTPYAAADYKLNAFLHCGGYDVHVHVPKVHFH
jgi:hypothetical protein